VSESITERPGIGASTCLLARPVRYDGERCDAFAHRNRRQRSGIERIGCENDLLSGTSPVIYRDVRCVGARATSKEEQHGRT